MLDEALAACSPPPLPHHHPLLPLSPCVVLEQQFPVPVYRVSPRPRSPIEELHVTPRALASTTSGAGVSTATPARMGGPARMGVPGEDLPVYLSPPRPWTLEEVERRTIRVRCKAAATPARAAATPVRDKPLYDDHPLPSVQPPVEQRFPALGYQVLPRPPCIVPRPRSPPEELPPLQVTPHVLLPTTSGAGVSTATPARDDPLYNDHPLPPVQPPTAVAQRPPALGFRMQPRPPCVVPHHSTQELPCATMAESAKQLLPFIPQSAPL